MKIIYAFCEIDFENNDNKNVKSLPLDNYILMFKTSWFSIHTNWTNLPIYTTSIFDSTVIENKFWFEIISNKWNLNIKVKKIISTIDIGKLSSNKIEKTKEINLQKELEKDIKKIYPNVTKEYKTPLGNIDLSYSDQNNINLLELKRNKIKLEDIKQIERYWEFYQNVWVDVKLYLIWEKYTDVLYNYLKDKNIIVCIYK